MALPAGGLAVVVGKNEGQGVVALARKVYNPEEESRDLGFGSLLAQRSGLRLLNRDGSFNVERRETHWWTRLKSYQTLVSMKWGWFYTLVFIFYFAMNAVFALLYLAGGAGGLKGDAPMSPFERAFFFSVHTFSTIGYGNIVPVGFWANMLVTVESLGGFLSFALATGLLFARFSRPHMDIEYSRNAVVAPYRGITAFMFRIVNKRDTQLIEVRAQVVCSRFEDRDGRRIRTFHPLRLERETVGFFPLAWTVVHPIDEDSPLWNWSHEDLRRAQTEYFVLLRAIDEIFSETVHSRSSYTEEETIWNAVFAPVFKDDGKSRPTMNWERFHAVEPVASAAGQD
ncbi:MAG: ion channel [Acidobacteriaceae bacterium]